MRAEFYRPDGPDKVVGRARWNRSRVEVDGGDEDRPALARIFRPSPVVVDDPSLRSFGTSGPTLLQPGSLRWFQEAALSRAHEEGLAVRLVPEGGPGAGFDPAGSYRPFDEQRERSGRVSAPPAGADGSATASL